MWNRVARDRYDGEVYIPVWKDKQIQVHRWDKACEKLIWIDFTGMQQIRNNGDGQRTRQTEKSRKEVGKERQNYGRITYRVSNTDATNERAQRKSKYGSEQKIRYNINRDQGEV